jgi:hypothetical protein
MKMSEEMKLDYLILVERIKTELNQFMSKHHESGIRRSTVITSIAAEVEPDLKKGLFKALKRAKSKVWNAYQHKRKHGSYLYL